MIIYSHLFHKFYFIIISQILYIYIYIRSITPPDFIFHKEVLFYNLLKYKKNLKRHKKNILLLSTIREMPHAPLLPAGLPSLLAVCLLAAPYCSASLVPWRLPHAPLLAAGVPPLLAVCLLAAPHCSASLVPWRSRS